MKGIILASASPRRREILALSGLDFEVISPECDENIKESDPEYLVQMLSFRKCMAGREEILMMPERNKSDHIIIGADTIVYYDGNILGKPRDSDDAVRMLTMLSGHTHSVYTGVTVYDTSNAYHETFFEKTEVTFIEAEPEDIRNYVDSGEPLDKAGAYGIQGKGAFLVSRINGDYLNVVGLPFAHLMQILKKILRS